MSAPLKPTHADIFERLGEIAGKLEDLEAQVGRIEAKVLSYDRLKERAVGAFMAASVAVAILWWVLKAKVATALGIGS